MSKIVFKTPSNQKEYKEYDLFRWEILRKPIGKDTSSLKDGYEESAFHLIGIKNKRIISGEVVADIDAHSSTLSGCELDAEMAKLMIDEYPILSVAAANANSPS